ncbi:MAG TPA: hypothetical protein VGM11_15715 [Acidobacteriaceae bacterium]|jgi:hypothetical protein
MNNDHQNARGRCIQRSGRLGLVSVAGWVLLLAAAAPSASAQAPQAASQDSVHPTAIVLGFVGGFVNKDDHRHPEVQIVQRLSQQKLPAVHAVVFENSQRALALKQLIGWLDTNGDGHLSAAEKQNARIILFGHSWGGSAVIKLADELNRRGIPVLLTIQVDSINKGWGHDCVIPANVAQATFFYQTRGVAHGCHALRTEDPSRTRITGGYEFEYAKQPPGCRSYPWFDRYFLSTHNAIGCDPRVWSQVEDEIQAQLQAVLGTQVAEVRR